MSWDTWRAHIEPDMRLVRLGRRKLIPVSELQAWLDRHAEGVGVGVTLHECRHTYASLMIAAGVNAKALS